MTPINARGEIFTALDFVHHQLPGRIVFGAGRRLDAPSEVALLDPSAVLVIGGSHDTSTIDDLLIGLNTRSDTIVGVRSHVPMSTVHDALRVAERLDANVVVTVGGGSATGLGKMIARERDVALVCLPTTYAGSEMTPVWGTTENGIKQTGRSTRVLPTTVIYDPELTVGLPSGVTVNSSFNALAHCIEALWLKSTSPISAEAATSAIRHIINGVRAVAGNPTDIDGRSELLFGAHQAGAVLASAGTGLLHATAHALGGLFDLEHGAMYAVLTPHMLSHHIDTTPTARRLLTQALGPDPRAMIDDLADELGAPRDLIRIGFPPDELHAAIEIVAQYTDRATPEIEQLLTAALEPRPAKETE